MPGAHERRPESRILLGAVTGAHGIRGEVRIKVFAEDPMAIASYGPLSDESGERTFTIARVRPGKGVVKVRGKNGWEVQVDTKTGEVLQTAIRRSDLIESIHDGSYFHESLKLWVFLPSGVVLAALVITGVHLFSLPHMARRKRRQQTLDA